MALKTVYQGDRPLVVDGHVVRVDTAGDGGIDIAIAETISNTSQFCAVLYAQLDASKHYVFAVKTYAADVPLNNQIIAGVLYGKSAGTLWRYRDNAYGQAGIHQDWEAAVTVCDVYTAWEVEA